MSNKVPCNQQRLQPRKFHFPLQYNLVFSEPQYYYQRLYYRMVSNHFQIDPSLVCPQRMEQFYFLVPMELYQTKNSLSNTDVAVLILSYKSFIRISMFNVWYLRKYNDVST